MEHRIQLPTIESVMRAVRAGDTVFISGPLFGIRDATQIRIFDRGVRPPVDLSGHFVIHTAPNVKKRADGGYEKICIGTRPAHGWKGFLRFSSRSTVFVE